MADERKIAQKFKMKRRRVVLTIQEKARIIEDFEKGLSTSDIKRKYNLPDSTAYDLKRKRFKLKEEIANHHLPFGKP